METVKKKRNMCLVLLLKQEKKTLRRVPYVKAQLCCMSLQKNNPLYMPQFNVRCFICYSCNALESSNAHLLQPTSTINLKQQQQQKKRRKESAQNGQNKRPSWTLMASVRRDDCVWPREESTSIIIIFDTKC